MIFTRLKRGFLNKLSDLTDLEKLLFVYILTHENNNSAGLFRLPIGYIVADMEWDIVTVTKGFAKLLRKGLLNYDFTNKIVLITKWFKYHPIQNPNQEINVISAISNLTNLKKDMLSQFIDIANFHNDSSLKELNKWFVKQTLNPLNNPLDNSSINSLGNKDKDKDKDTETDTETETETDIEKEKEKETEKKPPNQHKIDLDIKEDSKGLVGLNIDDKKIDYDL